MAKQHDIALRQLNALFSLGSLGGLTDGELLKLFTTRRDEAAGLAFAVLIDRHGPMVLRVCRAVLRDTHDAQDAFQATFLVLVQKARGLWVRECLGPWLYQVAHRTASGARSARARRRRHEQFSARSPVDGGAAEARDDLGGVLHDEVGRLPEQYRAAVVLCLLEGLTPEQAARRLGWPAGTVHSRLARGRARLRDRLRSRGLAPEMQGMDSEPIVGPVAVPPALITATGLAATRVAAGETLARVASASVVSLTKEGSRTHMFAKLLVAAGATFAAGIAVTAAGVLGYQATARPGAAPTGSQLGKTSQEGPPPDLIPKNPPQRPVIQKREEGSRRGQAMSLALSPDGNMLAASCSDRSVQLLDARTGEKRGALADVPWGNIRASVFTPDGKSIWGVGAIDQLVLWDVASGRSLKTLHVLGDMTRTGLTGIGPATLAISPDGGLVAVGSGGPPVVLEAGASFFEVWVVDAKKGELEWSHLGRRGFMQQLLFSPDGNTLAGATQSEVRLWDARAGDLKQTLKPKSGTVWSLAFSPDSRLLAGHGNERVNQRRVSCLMVWDLRSGAIVHSIEAGLALGAMGSGTLAFSPDGKSLASAEVGLKEGAFQKVINHIKLWDVASGALLWTSADGDLGNATSLLFSPDGRSLYCCDSSATTKIDAKSGQIRQDLMPAEESRPR